MSTIHAQVNARLLAKAPRLFTGTLAGRIIELLQNARRAGARHVAIANQAGLVTVRDEGRGVGDFAKLLDLGGSGWEAELEASEDPAGVGLFCLAPRDLRVRSAGRMITLRGACWTGRPVAVEPDLDELPAVAHAIEAGAGTELRFPDDPWTLEEVSPHAVFGSMAVSVDGEPCPREPFLRSDGPEGRSGFAHYPELGCRIGVVLNIPLSQWHSRATRHRDRVDSDVLVNFHGQVVGFGYRPLSTLALTFLVDLTGEPTPLRLMLPARTQLVENDAFAQLQAVLEREAYLHVLRQGSHRLYCKEYLRGRALGIELPEAEPVYRVGVLSDGIEPAIVEVLMPNGHPLARCYRMGNVPDHEGHESDEANVHLLAALGEHGAMPFIPLEIDCRYDGYSWAKLPTVGRVEVTASEKVLAESWAGDSKIICVESLAITAHCSDGRIVSSPVCMLVMPHKDGTYDSDEVYVTREAQERLTTEQIWHHLGGCSDEGDTYDTQFDRFEEDLDVFWAKVAGPHEVLRSKLLEGVHGLEKGWRSVTIEPDGRVCIRHGDGSEQVILPPSPD